MTSVGHWKVSAEMSTYAMDDMCGRVLDMSKLRNHSLALTYLRSSSFFSSRSCDLAVYSGHWWAEEVSWNKILFQFLDYQNHGDSCVSVRQTTDRINWDSASKTIQGLQGPYCGSNKPPMNKPFTTDKRNMLVIKFDADGYLDDDSVSFKLVLNVLHSDGVCSQYECDNGNCIPKELRCAKYNPCGDNSHCRPEGISVKTVIFIVIGVIAGIILLVLAVKYFRCKRKKSDDSYIDDRNLSPMGEMTGQEDRTSNQRQQTATAPAIVVEHDNEDNAIEHSKMLEEANLPPPSYEEVMSAEQR